jgi:hypothetical protein
MIYSTHKINLSEGLFFTFFDTRHKRKIETHKIKKNAFSKTILNLLQIQTDMKHSNFQKCYQSHWTPASSPFLSV